MIVIVVLTIIDLMAFKCRKTKINSSRERERYPYFCECNGCRCWSGGSDFDGRLRWSSHLVNLLLRQSCAL